jgi:enoyl-CoA hydratase/carnithine racemase
VRVVVLAAQGKAFCAGHNLKEMIARPELAYYQRLFAQCSRMMLAIQQLPVPVIARVQGIATAAGCQLVAQCDLAVASTEARFAVSGVNYGLFCATPSVPLLRNVPAKQAMEMLVTGEFISAEQAQASGLVNHAVAPDRVDAEIERLVASILAKPRLALAMGKDLFYRQREMGSAPPTSWRPDHGGEHDGRLRTRRRHGLHREAQARLGVPMIEIEDLMWRLSQRGSPWEGSLPAGLPGSRLRPLLAARPQAQSRFGAVRPQAVRRRAVSAAGADPHLSRRGFP